MAYASTGLIEATDYNNLASGPAWTGSGNYAVTNGGTRMTKTAGADSWDTQVYSAQGFITNVYASAKYTSASDGFTMFGLNSDPTANADYSSLDFSWYSSAGSLLIYENGASIGSYGTVTTTTVLSIKYDGTNVVYYKDGVAQRTVARAVGSPLYFDSSIHRTGFGIYDVTFGPIPSLVNHTGVTIGAGEIVDPSQNGGWNRAAYTSNGFTSSAYCQARCSSIGHVMFGLNSDPTTDANYTSIDYAWYPMANGQLYIYESGANPWASTTPYTTSTVLSITYDGTNITYLIDGVPVRQVARGVGAALYFDSSMYNTTGLNSIIFDAAPPLGASTSGSTANHGLGQSISSYAAVAATSTVTAAQWTGLIQATNSALAHQGQAAITPSSVTAGNNITYYSSIAQGASKVYANMGTTGLALSDGVVNTASYAGAWGTTGNRGLDFRNYFQFASADAVRNFFSAGGQIKVTYARSGGSATSRNTEWTALCSNCGTITVGYGTTTKVGGGGAAPAVILNSVGNGGYCWINAGWVRHFLQYDNVGTYSSNYIDTYFYHNGAGHVGVLTYMINAWVNTYQPGVDGTTSVSAVLSYPATTYLSNTWGTPTPSTSAALY